MPTVTIVDNHSFTKAIDITGGIEDLNTGKRLVIKVGIYDTDTGICSTVNTLNSIITSFDKAPEILIVESDSYAGPGLKRLEVWNDATMEELFPSIFRMTKIPK